MIKNFLLKKMMESKMKDVPPAERDKALEMIEKNPDLFTTIAKEVKIEMDKGKDQMAATMEVMQRHQAELQKLAQ
jgi:2-oxo-4-hydroxy-4-carboxy--5-ureidoimidazoline (OHCU) decarboxylase